MDAVSSGLSPAIEEFLLKFEAMAAAEDWTLIRNEPSGEAFIRASNRLHSCPLHWMAGGESHEYVDGPAQDFGLSYEEGWLIASAADNHAYNALTGGYVDASIRRRLLAACGLSE